MEEGLLWLKAKGEEPREPTVQALLEVAPRKLLEAINAAPTNAQARASLQHAIDLHRKSHELCMAMESGHACTIKALGKLLRRLLSETQSQMLLNAKDDKGTPGLYWAMEKGHADVIAAVGELLLHMPPEEQRQVLLNTKDHRGIPGLPRLFKERNWEALAQYIEVIKKITPGLGLAERAALLHEIRSSHAKKNKILGWFNSDDYAAFKKDNPALYSRFKEMKNALKR